MKLAALGERNGVTRVPAYRWFRAGALAAQGRELVAVDSTEVHSDVVRDMTEIVCGECPFMQARNPTHAMNMFKTLER